VSLVEQKLLPLPEYLSSPPVFSEVSVTRSLVLYVCFVDRCLSFCTFSFGHCVVCSSSICGFWLRNLQTLLTTHLRQLFSNKNNDWHLSKIESRHTWPGYPWKITFIYVTNNTIFYDTTIKCQRIIGENH
jgi:hypothetical protein